MENKLAEIQAKVKAPKGQFNSFGKYNYRSAEDILEAVKQVVNPMGYSITISDTIINVGDRYYIKATATLSNGKETWSTDGYAREEESKKGMDGSQVTGASSSYARKYSLSGLLDWMIQRIQMLPILTAKRRQKVYKCGNKKLTNVNR